MENTGSDCSEDSLSSSDSDKSMVKRLKKVAVNDSILESDDEDIEENEDELVDGFSSQNCWADGKLEGPFKYPANFNDLKSCYPDFMVQNAGSTLKTTCITPYDFFTEFISRRCMRNFCECTNAYAMLAERKNWTPLTTKEFRKFLAILLYMGIVDLPSREMYWHNAVTATPFVVNAMTYNRFNDIVYCLHYVDITILTGQEIQEQKKKDPYYLIARFEKYLAKKCQSNYIPRQELDVDEGCIPYKGRHMSKCYNPNKPNKWHLKVFCLNDPSNGYLSNFYFYRGKDEILEENISASNYPVWKLTEPIMYHNANYVLYTDNWFTSYSSVLNLQERYIFQAGTMRANKVLKANQGRLIKAKDHAARGEYKVSSYNQKLMLLSWQDNKPVHFLCTFMPVNVLVQRQRNGWRGKEKQTVSCPSVIELYNKAMGGTDVFDQMMSYYYCPIRSRKWTVRVFAHMFQIAAINAHILFKEHHSTITRKDKRFRYKGFMLALIDELYQHGCSLNVDPVTESVRRSQSKSDPNRFCGHHIPVHLPSSYISDTGRVRIPNRMMCVVCNKRSTYKCAQCNKGICIGTTLENNCWAKHHLPSRLPGNDVSFDQISDVSDEEV